MNHEKINQVFFEVLSEVENQATENLNNAQFDRCLGTLDAITNLAYEMKECSVLETECFNEITKRKKEVELKFYRIQQLKDEEYSNWLRKNK